jgi:RsiW-degrading membrane proteinase PrsW (M82 family)
MNYLSYPIYIVFAVLPSFIWLNFYLRRDVKPEPKLMILKIFCYGMLATLPAIFFERAIFGEFSKLNFSPTFTTILNIFLGVALVEEFLKFLVVKEKVLQNPEFDEPIDAMIYMIISALGFAAGENILIFVPLHPLWGYPTLFSEIFGVSLLRFLGATFLHALASAIIGFFIGLSFFEEKRRGKLIFFGLTLAILLHGFYNFSIMKGEGSLKLLIPSLLLIISAILVSFGFKKLKSVLK